MRFMVELQPSKQLIRTTLCGKMIKHKLKVVVGDVVTVEINSADISMGRIMYRWKSGQTPYLQSSLPDRNKAGQPASPLPAAAKEVEDDDDDDEDEDEENEEIEGDGKNSEEASIVGSSGSLS